MSSNLMSEVREYLKDFFDRSFLGYLAVTLFFMLGLIGVLSAVYEIGFRPEIRQFAMYEVVDSYIYAVMYGVVGLVSAWYLYFFGDLSESIGMALSGVWALGSGAQDVIVYLLCLPRGTCNYPSDMTWLDGTIIHATNEVVLGGGPLSLVKVVQVSLAWLLPLLVFLKILHSLEAEFFGLEV